MHLFYFKACLDPLLKLLQSRSCTASFASKFGKHVSNLFLIDFLFKLCKAELVTVATPHISVLSILGSTYKGAGGPFVCVDQVYATLWGPKPVYTLTLWGPFSFFGMTI